VARPGRCRASRGPAPRCSPRSGSSAPGSSCSSPAGGVDATPLACIGARPPDVVWVRDALGGCGRQGQAHTAGPSRKSGMCQPSDGQRPPSQGSGGGRNVVTFVIRVCHGQDAVWLDIVNRRFYPCLPRQCGRSCPPLSIESTADRLVEDGRTRRRPAWPVPLSRRSAAAAPVSAATGGRPSAGVLPAFPTDRPNTSLSQFAPVRSRDALAALPPRHLLPGHPRRLPDTPAS